MLALLALPICAQTQLQEAKMAKKTAKFFAKYKPQRQTLAQPARMMEYKVDNRARTLNITVDDGFTSIDFTSNITADIYKRLKKALPKPYNKYKLTVQVCGMTIDELVPNHKTELPGKSMLWGNIDYKGRPWTQNISSPVKITHGLTNRHIALWASHGFFYDNNKGEWRWQRPKLFSTTEDLFTPTIVVPYLIPMLEKAGAVVFTPRERDLQTNEIIVDNDDKDAGVSYIEIGEKNRWTGTGKKGFARHYGNYRDGENPFIAGTARMVKTTSKRKNISFVSYQPNIPEEGKYAVYVSYQTMENSIDDACYTVWHKGVSTDIVVNQQMGGGTWVYLGTFDFDKGCNEFNRIIISNHSKSKGIVTTDAIRLGGGMGNIERNGKTSGMPRSLEGARYYAQWAGMPYKIYSSKNGTDDYADDINTRSLMTNHLAGGSCYIPSRSGSKVPIELSLAIHSDAGYAKDSKGLIGSLAICTTNFNDGRLGAGISRMASKDLANALLTNVTNDLKFKYGDWKCRGLYDRNYSETRLPEMPSAILEILSHQNFPDMSYGQDPNFKFTIARSIYKTILKYVSELHGLSYVVTPLTPTNFRMEFVSKNEIRLSWDAVNDQQERTAKPTGYVVYTSIGSSGFDNGQYIRSLNSYKIKLEPGVLYSFRVAAVNRGGESFPSEVLCAMYNPNASKSIMIVNGFYRLSSPAIRHNQYEQGFDIDSDAGVTLGATAGWVGRQRVFNTCNMGDETETGLGWSSDELAGKIISGNEMNYVQTHAQSIAAAGCYNIASCSSKAVEAGLTDLTAYDATDLLLGLERNDGRSLEYYKTMPTAMRQHLQHYLQHGGALLVSGSYVATDMTTQEEQWFISNILKFYSNGSNRDCNETIEGMGTTLHFHHSLNAVHYAATAPDALLPVAPAYAALRYSNGQNAAVAYKGNDYRTFTMGFPFECITDKQKRNSIMRGILKFLTE